MSEASPSRPDLRSASHGFSRALLVALAALVAACGQKSDDAAGKGPGGPGGPPPAERSSQGLLL